MPNNCENCLLYKLFGEQPDYVNKKLGRPPYCCMEYPNGIPNELYDDKKECDKKLHDLEDENKTNNSK